MEVVEVDRGGKSTYHAPGQLVCYPILDLKRHGQDVKRYCRDLEEALIRTMAAFDIEATRIEGLTGVWLESPPRKIASIGIHLTKWISTHGYALNVDLDPAPFTDWITACGLDGYAFTSMARELGRPLAVDDVRPAAAQAFADVFELAFEDVPPLAGVVAAQDLPVAGSVSQSAAVAKLHSGHNFRFKIDPTTINSVLVTTTTGYYGIGGSCLVQHQPTHPNPPGS